MHRQPTLRFRFVGFLCLSVIIFMIGYESDSNSNYARISCRGGTGRQSFCHEKRPCLPPVSPCQANNGAR